MSEEREDGNGTPVKMSGTAGSMPVGRGRLDHAPKTVPSRLLRAPFLGVDRLMSFYEGTVPDALSGIRLLLAAY